MVFFLTSPELARENLASFRRGLGEIGYIESRNVAIEYRYAHGKNDQLATLAAELVRRQVSVIVTLESTQGALAAKAATQTIPIVFMQAADPIRIGLVDSLNRPGGNVTGIHLMWAEMAGKRRSSSPYAKCVPLEGDRLKMAQCGAARSGSCLS